jgi:antitoxin HicB
MNHYTMIIRWSAEDQTYLVTLPDWSEHLVGEAVTHGDTYEEAAKNGQIMLDLLVESYQAKGLALPQPKVYA